MFRHYFIYNNIWSIYDTDITEEVANFYLNWLQDTYPEQTVEYNITNDYQLPKTTLESLMYINPEKYIDKILQIKRNSITCITPDGLKTYRYHYMYIPDYIYHLESIPEINQGEVLEYADNDHDLPAIWFTNKKSDIKSYISEIENNDSYYDDYQGDYGYIDNTIYDLSKPNEITKHDKINILDAFLHVNW